MRSGPLPPNFPTELTLLAFSSGNEVAWSPDRVVSAVEWFGSHGYAALGTELWVVQNGAIQSLPLGHGGKRGVYGNTVNRQEDEAWSAFVGRSISQTRTYLQSFSASDIAERGELFFNVSWANESQFNELVAI